MSFSKLDYGEQDATARVASCNCTYDSVFCATGCNSSSSLMSEWSQVTQANASKNDVFLYYN